MIGDEHEAAAWFSGAAGKRKSKKAIQDAFDTNPRLKFGPVTFEILFPGDDRVPEPPVQGLRLIYATAKVAGIKYDDPDMLDLEHDGKRPLPKYGFHGDLDTKSADRLIRVTRRAYKEMNPGKPELSVERCVEYIEMVGPDVWERELKQAVDAGQV